MIYVRNKKDIIPFEINKFLISTMQKNPTNANKKMEIYVQLCMSLEILMNHQVHVLRYGTMDQPPLSLETDLTSHPVLI
jgi:hypothetical protein